jgi:hypothetical protein
MLSGTRAISLPDILAKNKKSAADPALNIVAGQPVVVKN